MSRTPQESRARLAAVVQWSRTPDRTARTAAARAAFQERTPDSEPGRFELQVDPELKLPPAQRARMAEAARRAYFIRLGLASGKARRARAAQKAGGDGTP